MRPTIRLFGVSIVLSPVLACTSGGEGNTTVADSSGGETTGNGGSDESASASGTTSDGTSLDSASATDASATDASATDGTSDGGDYQVWEMRMGGFSPPKFAGATWYGCEAWTFTVPGPVHIVGFRPQVDDPHVHHYVVEMYDSAVDADPIVPCVETPFEQMVWGWAPGGEDFMLPSDVGMRAGDTGVVAFRVQVHYNNPLGDDFADHGGFDVLYTEDLRPKEADILTTGAVSGDTIPAGNPAYEHITTCSNPLTGSEPANVIASWLHAHQIGKTLWTDLERAGGGKEDLGRADPFSFDKQTFELLDKTIAPGDSLATHCIYDASGRAQDTDFGEATDDEMCINFLLYWPAGAMPKQCAN